MYQKVTKHLHYVPQLRCRGCTTGSVEQKMNQKILKFFLASFFLAQNAWCACMVSAEGLNFGTYMSPNQNSDLLSTGGINLSCDSSVIGAVASIQISSGQSPTFLERLLSNGNDSLFYNLYVSSSRDGSAIWGDGTGISKTYTWTTRSSERITIFGKIPKAQSISPGSYTDSIQATLAF